MHTNAAADDEAQQLARLNTQPEEAMTALVEQYAPLICHVAGKYLTDPEDVKECVNDVFTEVYLHRAEYDRSKGSLASWIGTIARNRAISLYRKQRKDQPLPEDLAVLHASTLGRVQTLIIRGEPAQTAERLAGTKPLLCDLLPLSLEEIFMYELGGSGYDVKKLML